MRGPEKSNDFIRKSYSFIRKSNDFMRKSCSFINTSDDFILKSKDFVQKIDEIMRFEIQLWKSAPECKYCVAET